MGLASLMLWFGDGGGIRKAVPLGHANSTHASFEGDEQRGGGGIGSFQTQVMFEQLHGSGANGRKRNLLLARNAKLGFGKQRVVPIQSQYFGGP